MSISFALAAGANAQQGMNAGIDGGSGVEVETQLSTQNQGAQTQLQDQVRVQTGNYAGQNGESMQIENSENGLGVTLRTRNVSAHIGLNMTQEKVQNRTKLQVRLSNGLNAEIKVMPDTASLRAQEVLGAKCEEKNCTIELKEVGTGNQTRAAYEIKTQKESRVLGLFRAQMQVQTQIDAENGEVVQTKKPWWAFIATE